MIWTGLVTIVAVLVSPVLAVLPTFDANFMIPADALVATVGVLVGRVCAQLNLFLPMHEMLVTARFVVFPLLPSLLAFKAVLWGYTHLPEVFGWGPSGK